MRYAVIADLHGRRKSWRRVRSAAAAVGFDRLVVLGDYLDAKVPWRRHDPTRRYDLDEVVRYDPELWQSLAAEADLVLGNQEWRIRDLLQPDQVPQTLAPLLAAPERAAFGSAVGIHGHQLRWHEVGRRDDAGQLRYGLEPDAATLPAADRLLLAGHSHQTQILKIFWVTTPAGPAVESVQPIPVRPSMPIDVSAYTGPRRPDESGERWSTLFVNVGPARGQPSHWVIYEDERHDITLHEARSTPNGA
jgi:predicted phosphodiesterase